MCQHIERPSWMGSYSVDQCIRHLKEHGEWGSTLILCIRHLKEHPGWCPALYFTMFSICCASLTIVVTADASMWGERGYGDCSTHIHVTQWYRLAYVAAWLSSTGVSYHSLFPHTPSPYLLSKQQPSPSNCSRIPKLQLLDTVPFRGHMSFSGVCTAVARTHWFSLHLGFHRSAVSLSALNVYSMIQTIPPM